MDDVMRLPDGRQVGLVTHGDPEGYPVIFCHGTPGSRFGHEFTDQPGKEHGLRVIVAERPGYGLTTADPSFTILGWPDLVTSLADVLGLDRFAVVGYSGGGPYAIACAARLPDRVTALGLMAGVGPSDTPGSEEGVSKGDLLMMRLAVRRPRLAGLSARLLALVSTRMPKIAFRTFLKEAGPADHDMLVEQGPYALVPYMKGAFAQGPDGTVLDYRLLAEPWGIDLDAVRCPVDIWQGESDTFVPIRHAEDLASRLPGAQLHRLPNTGHASIQLQVGAIFEAVAAKAIKPS
jgi:pimeloyl-ACP methyl ester carboxylesterase